MTLQNEILNQMERITKEDKEVISAFLKKVYTQNPTESVLIEKRSVKSIKCVSTGSFNSISVPSRMIESLKSWLLDEGFIVKVYNNCYAEFCGYKIYLLKDYAL